MIRADTFSVREKKSGMLENFATIYSLGLK